MQLGINCTVLKIMAENNDTDEYQSIIKINYLSIPTITVDVIM